MANFVHLSMHDGYMRRCLELASKGQGLVSPNPLVGSLIVIDDIILAEGYHHQYGGPHAEREAISKVSDKQNLSKSTLYVNLEPCNHHGKTPPCSELIIDSGIKRVVVGMVDPNPLVSGSGIRRMKEAGIDVIYGICEQECKDLNKRFITFQTKQRPYIILKWAESKDGYIDKDRKGSSSAMINWITSPVLRSLVHKWRTEEDAILVGANTIIKDNPLLTSRYWSGGNPTRIVLENRGRLSPDSNVFNSEAPTIVYSTRHSSVEMESAHKWVRIEEGTFVKAVLEDLREKGITSILIEGGAKTLQSFINEDLWDEARVFVGAVAFNDGVKAPRIAKQAIALHDFGEEYLFYYKNQQ